MKDISSMLEYISGPKVTIQGWTIQKTRPKFLLNEVDSLDHQTLKAKMKPHGFFFPGRAGFVICHDIKPHDQLSQRVGKNAVGWRAWSTPWQEWPGPRHLTPGVCEGGVGTEREAGCPGWDEHSVARELWSEGSSFQGSLTQSD